MAATIDERIVAMSFENQVFEQRAAQTMTTLGKLNTAIKSMDSAKGLDDIEKSGNKVTLKGPMAALDKLREKLGRSGQGAAQGLGEIERAGSKVTLDGPNKAIDKTQAKLDHLGAGSTFSDIEKASNQVELSGITKAIESVSGRFGMLQQAASVALGNISAQAIQKGAGFAKSFAIGPITDGLDEYKTNLNSIQTILANTDGQKVSGLDEVNKHLDELNHYSDQTIYNFSEMAKNIGTFTAAGVDMDTSTQSIKGIANLAALSGSNSQQASTAMYQLSQAIASGKVGLQDWNSVVNAGMGGAVFQKALAKTADNMGALEKGALKIDKATGKATINGDSFRESIMAKPGQKSWLTSEVLTTTLKNFTGDMKEADLIAQGFSKSQAQGIMKQAATAKAAATEVKTLSQAFDVAKETIGSGWSATFKNIFGDFEESKKTFTSFSNGLNGFLNRSSDARNKLLKGWHDLGGRDVLFGGLQAAIKGIGTILKPIQDAFREIFPPTTAKQLFEMTKSFANFAKSIAIDPSTADKIKRIFAGIFSIFSIGKEIIKGVIGVVFDLLGVASKGSGGFLEFVAKIGDFLVAVNHAVTQGEVLKGVFSGISSVLAVPVKLLMTLVKAIADFFAAGDGESKLTDQLGEVRGAISPVEKIVARLKEAWGKLVDGFAATKAALEPWFSSFVGKLSSIGQTIADAFANLSFDQILSGIQTGLLGGLLIAIRKLFGAGGGLIESLTGTMDGVNKLLGGVTGNLEAMQKKVQAQTLLAIAAAVLALAGGVFILSTIDGDKLAKAMAAVAIGLGELMGAMKLMAGGLGKFGALMLPVIAAGIIGLAIAVNILALAMKIFATMSWEEIGKGLAGVGGALGVIAAAMKFMPAGPMMIAQAGGLLVLGLALNTIAAAVKVMGGMKWEDLGKGLYAVVTAMGILALTMGMMPPNMLASAAALVVVSFALMTLSGAIKAMGSMDLATLTKGIGGAMVALAALGVAMIPWFIIAPSLIPAAAGLFIVSGALVVLGKALEIIGGIGIVNLVKGLAAIGIALVELAVGMYLMIGTLPGAVAMMAAAAALAVLAPVLAFLGNLEWSTIFKGLAAIALVLTTIGIAGLIAAPALAALGIAMIPLGLGFMLVAGAAKIFASALAMLSDSGQKGIAVFLTALTGFVALLPTIIISFIKGLLTIVEEVANIGPKVVVALGKILETIIQFITDNAVKLAMAIGLLVDSIVMVLVENIPKLVAAGVKLLQGMLDGISQNIGAVTTKVSEIVVKFLSALTSKVPSLIAAGANLLRKFLDGVSSRFGEIATSVANLIVKFTQAVGNQAGKIATAAGIMMGKFVAAIATYSVQVIAAGAKAIGDLLTGIGQKGPELIKKGVQVAGKILKGIADGLVGLADMGLKAIIQFLNGLEAAIRENSDDLIDAGLGVGDAIMDGIVQAFTKGGGAVRKALEAVFKLMPGWAKKILGIKSPSKVFTEIGEFTMAGFVKGVGDSKGKVQRGVEDVGKYSMVGMAKGISDNQKVVSDAAMGASGAMLSTVRGFLGIHSPSEVFREIGMNVNRGFSQGLRGSEEDVISAVDSMNSSLIDKIRELRTSVADGNTKVEDLQQQHADKLAEIAKMRKEKKPDTDAIADAVKESQDLEKQITAETAAVNQNGKALKASRDIRKTLTVGLKDEQAQLITLRRGYEVITKQLEDASAALENAQKAREDAQKKYTDQYSAKPDVDKLVSDALAEAELTAAERQEKIKKDADDAEKRRKIDQVALYKQALQEQIVATVKYQATLQKLKELGLDDETYTKLLEKGLDGQEFASQLLASGKAGIDQINKLNAEMLAKSTDLAKQAAANLYDAGVSAAQGLVDGLAKKKVDLETAMTSLADVMVNAIKKKLKIKSPSRIFMEVGKFTGEGLAQGLRASSQSVTGAANALGDDATAALTSSLGHILDTVGGEIDPELVITPVLDLTQIRKDATAIEGMSNVIPITAATSYGMGSATAQEVSASQQAALETAASAKPSVEFTQNNYSPESLSAVEIYRNTRNQIGQLKSALGVPA